MRNSVSRLCDVRRNAISRKYGFARSTLQNACSNLGIDYVHKPEFGIGSNVRSEINSVHDRDAVLNDYESHSLPTLREAINCFDDWLGVGETVALTCFEREVQNCHRGRLANQVSRILNRQFEVRHL